jgi:two-component system, NarL family, response regulator NreC
MRKRIMVVDDSSAIRRALQRVLESNPDWAVCGEAADGVEGIQKAQELKPDLIVLDISMPVMDGLAAARIIHDMLPDVPLILCSLHSDDVVQGEARAAGASAVISKSQNVDRLVAAARELLCAA